VGPPRSRTPRGEVERPTVQILVVVANIKARTLKAEVGKGFLRTAVGQELIDPKRQINLVKRTIGPSSGGPLRSPERRKGIRLNIPESGVGSYGNVTELGDGRHCPGESSLFSLTGQTSLESYRTEIGSDGWQSIPISGVSGAQRLFHENPRDGSVLDPGRTNNRSRSPRFEASGQ